MPYSCMRPNLAHPQPWPSKTGPAARLETLALSGRASQSAKCSYYQFGVPELKHLPIVVGRLGGGRKYQGDQCGVLHFSQAGGVRTNIRTMNTCRRYIEDGRIPEYYSFCHRHRTCNNNLSERTDEHVNPSSIPRSLHRQQPQGVGRARSHACPIPIPPHRLLQSRAEERSLHQDQSSPNRASCDGWRSDPHRVQCHPHVRCRPRRRRQLCISQRPQTTRRCQSLALVGSFCLGMIYSSPPSQDKRKMKNKKIKIKNRNHIYPKSTTNPYPPLPVPNKLRLPRRKRRQTPSRRLSRPLHPRRRSSQMAQSRQHPRHASPRNQEMDPSGRKPHNCGYCCCVGDASS